MANDWKSELANAVVKFFDGAATEVSGMITDHLRVVRYERACRLHERI